LPELCRQSIDYAGAWLGRGLPGMLLPVEGANHFDILDSLARVDGELARVFLKMAM